MPVLTVIMLNKYSDTDWSIGFIKLLSTEKRKHVLYKDEYDFGIKIDNVSARHRETNNF